jgi:hypothetical protein
MYSSLGYLLACYFENHIILLTLALHTSSGEKINQLGLLEEATFYLSTERPLISLLT